jgi:endonuclease-3
MTKRAKKNKRTGGAKSAGRASGSRGRPRARTKGARAGVPAGGGRSSRPPIRAIINRLEKEYPGSRVALDFGSPVELLVATILAAQCTDERVNQVTKVLFAKYRTPVDYARASLEDLMEIVRSTGFFRNKSKSIKAACGKIVEDFGGEVPRTMAELVSLPGVARKTANIVLGDAFGVSEGIAVDTHMLRLSRRLGLTKEKDPVKVERDLCEMVPRSKWLHFPHLIADHGRAVCKARTPMCGDCAVARLCPSRM